ncbi:MAG: hypothetical protein ACRET7_00225 [Burkholderiales bacterium]
MNVLYAQLPANGSELVFFDVNLGNLSARGEFGLLIVTLDSLVRASSNPFFPYMLGRIEEGITAFTKAGRN